jgi:hypothetical protein
MRDGLRDFLAVAGIHGTSTPWPVTPTAFTDKTADELAVELDTGDDDIADGVLEEAKAQYERAADRADSAERRATTLQGAVAIAGTLTLSGGGLVLDTSKIEGEGWRIAFGIGIVAVAWCLITAGYRAVCATSRLYGWASPSPADALKRREQGAVKAKVARAADLLKASANNDAIATRKLMAMSSAAAWFVRALLLILVVSALIGAYAVSHASTSSKTTTTKSQAPAK